MFDHETDHLTTRIPNFDLRPAHIGILPRDGSSYYAWYDDGTGRTYQSYLLDFTLVKEDDHIHVRVTSGTPNTAPVIDGVALGLYAGISQDFNDAQRHAVACALRSLYVSQAMHVTHLQDEHATLGLIPRRVHDPVFQDARNRRVAIHRALRVPHHTLTLFARFVTQTNERLDAQETPPAINYQRNW